MSNTKAVFFTLGLLALSPLARVHAQSPATAAAPPAAAIVAPEPAAKVIAAATEHAKANGKQVLVVFHASWCGWCKRLDATFLNDPEMSKLMAAHYEVIHLDVSENGPKKSLENPGGNDMMTTLGGAKSGLPFYAVLDTNGKKLADSNRMKDNANIGYPGAPDEIVAFVNILKETAPTMTAAELAQVSDHLKKNAPKE